MKGKNEKGFSLVELLVVVIIIGIIAAIAIPNLLASRRAANEASAINSLRTINSAQVTYFVVGGNNANYGTIANLAAISLIDSALASGSKSGYTISVTLPGAVPFSVFCASALATTFGSSGIRDFGVDQIGVIYANDTDGLMNCAAGVLDPGAGSGPIQ